MSTAAVASASVYRAADGLLARRGHSFHWARRLLSEQHAERATRLYGFCRRVDDTADEAIDSDTARAELNRIGQILQSGQCPDETTADMLQLMQVCEIDPAIPLELISGVASDLEHVRVADVDALLHYCYQVAGTVGLMMTAALDVRSPAALPHAIDLGIAMQLTNICRDVRDDALMGRRYLPASLVGELEPSELVHPTAAVRSRVTPALGWLLDTADRYYASGEQGLQHLPPGARTGIRVAARSYRAIGTVLREREYDCWSSRAHVGSVRKAAITVRALAATAGAQLRCWAGVSTASTASTASAPSTQLVFPRHPVAVSATESGRAR